MSFEDQEKNITATKEALASLEAFYLSFEGDSDALEPIRTSCQFLRFAIWRLENRLREDIENASNNKGLFRRMDIDDFDGSKERERFGEFLSQEQAKIITVEDAFAAEPRLKLLSDDIDAIKRLSKGKERFCANAHWYGRGGNQRLKRKLQRLAGWYAVNPIMDGCYDLMFKRLYNALPDCRGCGCIQAPMGGF